MNNWMKKGIIFLFLFLIATVSSACTLSGNGLDDAQTVCATYFSMLYAKGEQFDIEKRKKKIESISTDDYKNKTGGFGTFFMANIMKESMTDGVTKTFYIGDDPLSTQTDTKRTLIVRIQKENIRYMFTGEAIGSYYEKTTLIKTGDSWKIDSSKKADEDIIKRQQIAWKEVKPSEYLK